MRTSIGICILVEVIKMCEYHLKGNCFHPEKVSKGNVANKCDVHECNQCTNRTWQTIMINKEINYHQAILNMALQSQEENTNTAKLITTKIEVEEESRFRSPFRNFLTRKEDSGKLHP